MSILIRNVDVITQNSKRDFLRGADVYIEENRIAGVGRGIKESAEFRIDGKGKLLLPGFVNAHNHAAMALFRGYADDMALESWLKEKVWPLEAKLKGKDIYWGTMLACVEMMKGGTTSFADMYFFMEDAARAVGESGMRALLSYGMIDLGDAERREKELRKGEGFVREFSGKFGKRVMGSLGPHAPYTCSGELLVKSDEISRKYGVPIQIHVSETRKEVYESMKNFKARPVEYLDKNGLLSSRVIASHCVWLSKREIGILAGKKASVAHNPVSNLKLASGIAPASEMMWAGVNVALGTDGAASNNSLSMLETAKFAALLQKARMEDASVFSAQSALDCATVNGARALGIDAGVVEKGKLADVILIDMCAPNLAPAHSAVSHVVYAANASNVSDVIIDGKIVVENGKLKVVDEEKVVEEAHRCTEKLVG